MATLFSATLDLARILGNVMESTTSAAGTTTKLIDTTMPRVQPPNDAFNYGTLWFISGALAGYTAVVTDWVLATSTFTFVNPMTVAAAPGAASRYAFCDKDWPRDVLRQAVNAALQTIGGVTTQYTNATFITVQNQMAYTLPAGVYNVKRVEVATSLTAPYDYAIHHNWTETPTQIIFHEGFQIVRDGYLIRLTYEAQPAELTTDAGTIDSRIHPDLLKWTAAVNAWMWKEPNIGDPNSLARQRLAYSIQMADSMKKMHRVPKMMTDPKLSRWMVENIEVVDE